MTCKLGDIPGIEELDVAAVLLVLANYVEHAVDQADKSRDKLNTGGFIRKTYIKSALLKHLNTRRDSEYKQKAKDLVDQLLQILIDIGVLTVWNKASVDAYRIVSANELRRIAGT